MPCPQLLWHPLKCRPPGVTQPLLLASQTGMRVPLENIGFLVHLSEAALVPEDLGKTNPTLKEAPIPYGVWEGGMYSSYHTGDRFSLQIHFIPPTLGLNSLAISYGRYSVALPESQDDVPPKGVVHGQRRADAGEQRPGPPVSIWDNSERSSEDGSSPHSQLPTPLLRLFPGNPTC